MVLSQTLIAREMQLKEVILFTPTEIRGAKM